MTRPICLSSRESDGPLYHADRQKEDDMKATLGLMIDLMPGVLLVFAGMAMAIGSATGMILY